MGILDSAAARLGYMRQDAAPAPALSSAPETPGPTQRQTLQRRNDDFASILSHYSSRPMYGPGSGTLSAEELYGTDGLASLIIDRPAEDAVARWFKVDGDEREEVLGELDRLDATTAFVDALRWGRLFGAAAIMPLVNDGQPLFAPLDLSRVRQITDLMVYPATAISMGGARYSDPAQTNYGWPTHYDVRPRWGASFSVHETRLFPVSGDPLPFSAGQSARLPWLGRGVLDSCGADLHRYREVLKLAKMLLFRKQQPVHAMSGLGEMLTAGLDDVVAKRLDTADLARSMLTTVAVDAGDRFQVLDSNLSGVRDIILESKVALCASSGVPMLVLFGEQSTGGMNNNGEGQHEAWHQRLRKEQARLQPAAERLVGLVYSQQVFRRREPAQWDVVWNELWSPTEKESAEVEKLKAEARRINMEAVTALGDAGLASPEENRDLARITAFPELPRGQPPEPEPVPLPDDQPPANQDPDDDA
jgi:phage-related protein (TIGR01555 family)